MSLFSLIINNIKSQKYINDIEIIIVSRNKNIINKDKDVKYIYLKDNKLTTDEAYIKILPNISGKYIAIVDENKIIDTNNWLYQSLMPIINNQAIATLFLNNSIKNYKNKHIYPDLKQRIYNIDNNDVLFLPMNRDLIENIDPEILNNPNIVVKKKISNYYLI